MVSFRKSTVLICFCQLGSLNKELGWFAGPLRFAIWLVGSMGPNMIHLHLSYNPVTHDLLTSDILRDLKHIWALCNWNSKPDLVGHFCGSESLILFFKHILAMEKQSYHQKDWPHLLVNRNISCLEVHLEISGLRCILSFGAKWLRFFFPAPRQCCLGPIDSKMLWAPAVFQDNALIFLQWFTKSVDILAKVDSNGPQVSLHWQTWNFPE